MADTDPAPPPPSNPAASLEEEQAPSTQTQTQTTTQTQPDPQPQSQSQSESQQQQQQQPPAQKDPTKNASSSSSHPQYTYIQYSPSQETAHVSAMQQLIMTELSEPYSIYVYRYFLYQWGELCFMCYDTTTHPSSLAGCIISKLEPHTSPSGTSPFPPTLRGYIAMLAVPTSHRGRGIATRLVRMAIDAMVARDADEVVLETEVTNEPAIKLYQRLGFLRSKRLHRYYLSGGSAFRLVLPLKEGAGGFGMMVTGEGEGQGDGLPVREDEEHLGRHVC